MLTTTYVLNRIPTKSITTTPYEIWTRPKIDLSYLRPWGCATCAHDNLRKCGKLGLRGRKEIFIRYPEISKGYVLVGEQEDGTVNEYESQDGTFLEREFPTLEEVSNDFTLYETQESEQSRSHHLSERDFLKLVQMFMILTRVGI